MKLSIIFVNWNSVGYLLDCIPSIYEHTRGMQFEIIVIDNASPHDDMQVLRQRFPDVTVIQSAKNLGFAGANNVASTHASGEYLLFLNPDTKLIGPAINTMVEHAEKFKGGVIGCKLLNGDLSLQTSCIQRFPTILNQALDANLLRSIWPSWRIWGTAPLYSAKSGAVPVEVISGACLLVKRSVFKEVGGFSSEYFMYAEDVDLCYKVSKAGFNNYYVGDAAVIHYGGGSSVPRKATIMKWKSIVQYVTKTHGRSYALLFRAVMTVVALVRLMLLSTHDLFRPARASREYSGSAKWHSIMRTMLHPSEQPVRGSH